MAFKSYRAQSRIDWGTESDSNLTLEQIKVGALLRIADSLEKMAQPYADLVQSKERYKRYYEEENAEKAKLHRRLAGLRGAFNHLKSKRK